MITGLTLNKMTCIIKQGLLLLLDPLQFSQSDRIQPLNWFEFLTMGSPNRSMILMPIYEHRVLMNRLKPPSIAPLRSELNAGFLLNEPAGSEWKKCPVLRLLSGATHRLSS